MSKSVQVFRNEPGFIKLFILFKEKYRSLGRVGGTVSILSFTEEEMEAIAGFMGLPAYGLLEKGKVALLDFEKALLHTSFADFSLIQLMEEVLGETILTKNEEHEFDREKTNDFFNTLQTVLPEGIWWWDWIKSKQPDTRWIWSLYKQNSNQLMEYLLNVFRAFLELPKNNSFERLPLFAQRTTGNPHYFDQDQTAGKLLIHCMYVDQLQNDGGILEQGMPKSSEEVNELFAQYGLMKDDLWSFVTCNGLLAEDENGIHPVWQAASSTNTVLNVPIKELLKVNKIRPVNGNKVWVVENSGVCSTIIDEVPSAPIICTHGQFRSASWVAMDLLVGCGYSIYYSGDLDPEGISMAQRLKNRYPNNVTLWRMDKESYEQALSEEDVTSRLAKIEVINLPELEEVVYLIKHYKKAAYQEGFITLLIQDILET
ncbi:TIGR02679 family protein [Schinkia azotoformans]|uniref:TIGR02679 family protein n=1 Tax=Schinkia azotoformans TaxID=1454 RepID=UPI002DB8D00C|nr:TIGR02679 family protein [Schinkia azotoformans]MEC1714444.1 TIGR02679 family protein [Schinkia azotoformans]MEC1740461.1 TIGR02679 family protein [Schinkia azotoformans]MEC1744982.1 TIGR02679 family protein [Schinkia azotoformans]MEC1756778.1 TIGR02679 family protein [Schinkia azotoformans]MEC1768754.1 TIGR02679 family protein [Schinkia azotoformans]